VADEKQLVRKLVFTGHISVPERKALPGGTAKASLIRSVVGEALRSGRRALGDMRVVGWMSEESIRFPHNFKGWELTPLEPMLLQLYALWRNVEINWQNYPKAKLEALDRHVREELGTIPAKKRQVITSHDAFGYYGKAYGVTFLAPEGISTDSEPSAKTIAELIRQIRREGIKALFLENISAPRLVEELARETGAVPGPPLYSDALSPPNGPAPTYIQMIEYNTAVLKQGMLKN